MGDIIAEITKVYNESHRLYLKGVPCVIFMTNFLEGIARIFNIKSGFIGSWNENNYIILEAILNNSLLRNNINFPDCTKFSASDKDSYCCKCITNNEIIEVNDVKNDFIFDLSQYPIFTYIPFSFNNVLLGVVGMSISIRENLDAFNILSNYIGILCYSYRNIKMSTFDDNKFITYHLTDEVLNLINDGVIMTNQSFEIVYLNEASKSIFNQVYGNLYKTGYLNKSLINVFPQLRTITPNDVTDKIYKNRHMEIIIKDKSNSICLDFIINTVLCNGLFYHIVNLKHKKDDIKESVQKGQRNLIAYLSHELRNPLQTIVLANHLIHANKDNVSNKTKFNLSTINKSCNDMRRIINDILDLSKIDANEFQIEMECHTIQDIIDDIINECEILAKTKGLGLECNIQINVPESLYTDITRVEQILNNLVSNAIKYSERGTIIINVRYDDEKHSVIFDIIDQGIGIHNEEICHLFKDYGQTSNSLKLNNDSNGLGLCISQKISNLLGGYITVKSEHKKGSTFSLCLPIKLGISGNTHEKVIIDGTLNGNILLVDDNESNLMLFKMLLENFNYEYKGNLTIESVSDGKDAIELCKVNKYNVIFMDINMMGIDGCTASKVIKMCGYNGAIIATTGNILAKSENRESIDTERYSYFNDVLIKPFDDTTVLNILKKYL